MEPNDEEKKEDKKDYKGNHFTLTVCSQKEQRKKGREERINE